MKNDSVDCLTDGKGLFYSKECPDRAVQRVFLGFALYERAGEEGFHKGVANEYGAWQWLSGLPLDEVDHYKVVGVNVPEN